ncbi:MAG: hypothetical protein J7501_13960 [Bdellovibrio sp.]|nr:hypothetical protein [Bdellovibrio sp.]
MKSVIAFIAVLGATTSAFAARPTIEQIAKKIKDHDTRTIVKVVENNGGEPCLPEGKSYSVELQVKHAAYDRINEKVVYSWITEKTVSVSLDGSVMEVCGE